MERSLFVSALLVVVLLLGLLPYLDEMFWFNMSKTFRKLMQREPNKIKERATRTGQAVLDPR